MTRDTRFVLVLVAILALLAVPAMAQEAKNQAPPSGPGTPGEATGGPDVFGYTWADQADGCTYDFIDISATGAFVVAGDEDAAPVTLGGSFNFYGVDLTAMGMASNGYLSSDPAVPGGDLSNDCPLPAVPSTGGGARLYPLHDDLEFPPGTPGAGYYEYFSQCPRANPRCTQFVEPCSVFMWDDVAQWQGTQTWDQEVVLYHASGDMVFQIGAGNPQTGSSSTTGIQNEAADEVLMDSDR